MRKASKRKNSDRPRERAFLNCEIDPPFYYRNLKAICLLFDEVIIWAPSEDHLANFGFAGPEIVNGFLSKDNEIPLLTPGGRNNYFNGRREQQPTDSGFRKAIEQTAEQCGTILPEANRDEFYGYVAGLGPEWKPHMERVATYLAWDVKQRSPGVDRKLEWAQKTFAHHRLDWSGIFLGEFLLDMGACVKVDDNRRRLNLVNVLEAETFPLVDPRFADGYRMIQNAILATAQPAQHIRKFHADKDPTLDRNFHLGRERTLIEGISDIFEINLLPWSEVRKLKRSVGDDLRTFFKLRINADALAIEGMIDSARRAERLIWLSDEILKRAISTGHEALQQILTPGNADPLTMLSASEKVLEHNVHGFSAMVDSLPFITRYAASRVGLGPETVEKAGELVDVALASFRTDKTLHKLLRKPLFNVASISRIGLSVRDTRLIAHALKAECENAGLQRVQQREMH